MLTSAHKFCSVIVQATEQRRHPILKKAIQTNRLNLKPKQFYYNPYLIFVFRSCKINEMIFSSVNEI